MRALSPFAQALEARPIKTSHEYPPIPIRTMDWCAYFEGEEEAGNYGWGATEAEAIADFLENCAEPHPTIGESLDALTTAIGPSMLTSSKITDDMMRALYWKRIVWAETVICEYYGYDDERESVRVADDSRREAIERHAAIINMLWQQRRMLRLADACVTRTVALTAWAKGETPAATGRALEEAANG